MAWGCGCKPWATAARAEVVPAAAAAAVLAAEMAQAVSRLMVCLCCAIFLWDLWERAGQLYWTRLNFFHFFKIRLNFFF
jgi:hypothetical protein